MVDFKRGIMVLVLAFLFGWVSNTLYTQYTLYEVEQPLSMGFILGTTNLERVSPQDHLQEADIHVLEDKIIIDVDDAMWSSFADTNSMDPFLDEGSNGIEVKPRSELNVRKGDIISFTSDYAEGLIIHRVIEVGYDKDGWYAKTKGDNNVSVDPGKVRFEDINGVLIGILY